MAPLGALHDEAAVPEPGRGPRRERRGRPSDDAASAPPAIDTHEMVPPVHGSGLRRKTVLEKLLGITCGLRLVCFDESADDDDPEGATRRAARARRAWAAARRRCRRLGRPGRAAADDVGRRAAPAAARRPRPSRPRRPRPRAASCRARCPSRAAPAARPQVRARGRRRRALARRGPGRRRGARGEAAGSPCKMPEFAKAPAWEQIDMSAARPSRKWRGPAQEHVRKRRRAATWRPARHPPLRTRSSARRRSSSGSDRVRDRAGRGGDNFVSG